MKTKFKSILPAWLLLAALLLAGDTGVLHAADGTALRTNVFNGAGNGNDVAQALAVDVSGNVFVTGNSINSGSQYNDCATIKYSNAGVPMWTNVFNRTGNGDNYGQAVAVDGSGNVFVTGKGAFIYATIKYSSAGVPLWTNLFNRATGNSSAIALAVDGSGNVFVTGSSTVDALTYDYATIKYSNAGVPLWTNIFNRAANSDDNATGLAVDGSGNVFVTGYSGVNSYDYVTIKYSNTGLPLWTNLFNGAGNGNDSARALALDGSGNVFVTGNSTGSGTSSDYATIKYSNAGVPLWTNVFNGTGNGNDAAKALAVDGSGNVFVTGFSTGSGTSSDYATIKYSNAGVPLWTNVFNGAGNGSDQARALAVDGSGNVFVTGYATGSGTSYDFVTIKYSGSSGTPISLAFTNPFLRVNQQFGFTLTGPAGSNTIISVSTNLQTWTPLITNPLAGGALNFTDAVSTNLPLRFYRAQLQ